MGIVCFRYYREGVAPEEDDALNEEIVEAVNARGRAYLNRTRLNGRAVMRVGLGNVLTTEAHLTQVWDAIRAESNRAL